MEKAIELQTGIQGLSIGIGTDGLWMHFSTDEKRASINLSYLSTQEKSKIVGDAIFAWCKQTAEKAHQGRPPFPCPKCGMPWDTTVSTTCQCGLSF